MKWQNKDKHTSRIKMNAGEQSFYHIPFTIDYIHELIVKQSKTKKDKLKATHRECSNGKKKFLILIYY